MRDLVVKTASWQAILRQAPAKQSEGTREAHALFFKVEKLWQEKL